MIATLPPESEGLLESLLRVGEVALQLMHAGEVVPGIGNAPRVLSIRLMGLLIELDGATEVPSSHAIIGDVCESFRLGVLVINQDWKPRFELSCSVD